MSALTHCGARVARAGGAHRAAALARRHALVAGLVAVVARRRLAAPRRSELGRRRPPASRRALPQHRRRQRRLAGLGRRVLRRRALAAFAVQHGARARVRLRDTAALRDDGRRRGGRTGRVREPASRRPPARGARRHGVDRARLLPVAARARGARACAGPDRRPGRGGALRVHRHGDPAQPLLHDGHLAHRVRVADLLRGGAEHAVRCGGGLGALRSDLPARRRLPRAHGGLQDRGRARRDSRAAGAARADRADGRGRGLPGGARPSRSRRADGARQRVRRVPRCLAVHVRALELARRLR